jgi:SAM-dependent methyltransferase
MELKGIFDTNARQYDRSRPKYHPVAAAIIGSFMELDPSKRLLEIGCGAGQATELFVGTGARIISLDIGPNLIGLCREKFREYANASFELAEYEDYASSEKFDLIFSATAFHWIRQPEGDIKTRELLRDDGIFALFKNHHIFKDEGFFADSQRIYDKYMDRKEAKEAVDYGMMNAELFDVFSTFEYRWEEVYSIEDYLGLLSTYSDHLALSETDRSGLFEDLEKLATTKYGGKVEKRYLLRLELGRKR